MLSKQHEKTDAQRFVDDLRQDLHQQNSALDRADKIATHGRACITELCQQLGELAYRIEGRTCVLDAYWVDNRVPWGRNLSRVVLRFWRDDLNPGTVCIKWYEDGKDHYTNVDSNAALESKFRKILTQFITVEKYK